MSADPKGLREACGVACPHRDWINGSCERHGPTAADRVVKRVTSAFRADVRSILRDNRNER